MSRNSDPSQDPPGTCRWRNPRDSGPWIKVADNRWVHVGGGGGQDDEVVADWPVGPLRASAPVDWSARFRAAAEVAEGAGWDAAAHVFGALGVKAKHSPYEVGAIVRALLGEAP